MRTDDSTTDGDESRRRHLLRLVDAGDGQGSVPTRHTPGEHRARLGRVCAVVVSEVGVSGAGVTVMGSVEDGLAGHRDQLWSTGDLSRCLEDLQLTAGEGPCLDAYSGAAPVLVPDLIAESDRWLGFAGEAIAAGAAAVFSLPLQVGALRLGTLDLHRDTPGPLSREQLADALVLASLATELLLELVGDPEGDGDADPAASPTAPLLSESAGWLPDVHARVHQASGMISAREHISVGEALMRIRAYAFAHGQLIDQVAGRIVLHDLGLNDAGDDDPGYGATGPDPERDR